MEEQACLAKEEAERLRREKEAIELKAKLEEEERLVKERETAELSAKHEKERIRIEEQARLAKEETERLQREEETAELKANQVEADRLKQEKEAKEVKAKQEEEQERLRQEEQDRLAKEEQERLRQEEQDRLAKEEAERLQREKEAIELKAKSEEEERLVKEREAAELSAKHEKERIQIEEQARLAKEETERLQREKEEAERLQKEKEEAEGLLKEKEAAELKAKQVDAERLRQEREANELKAKQEEEKERFRLLEQDLLAEVETERVRSEKEAAEQKANQEEDERIRKEKEAADLENKLKEKERLQKEGAELKAKEGERVRNEEDRSDHAEIENTRMERATSEFEAQKDEVDILPKVEQGCFTKAEQEPEDKLHGSSKIDSCPHFHVDPMMYDDDSHSTEYLIKNELDEKNEEQRRQARQVHLKEAERKRYEIVMDRRIREEEDIKRSIMLEEKRVKLEKQKLEEKKEQERERLEHEELARKKKDGERKAFEARERQKQKLLDETRDEEQTRYQAELKTEKERLRDLSRKRGLEEEEKVKRLLAETKRKEEAYRSLMKMNPVHPPASEPKNLDSASEGNFEKLRRERIARRNAIEKEMNDTSVPLRPQTKASSPIPAPPEHSSLVTERKKLQQQTLNRKNAEDQALLDQISETKRIADRAKALADQVTKDTEEHKSQTLIMEAQRAGSARARRSLYSPAGRNDPTSPDEILQRLNYEESKRKTEYASAKSSSVGRGSESPRKGSISADSASSRKSSADVDAIRSRIDKFHDTSKAIASAPFPVPLARSPSSALQPSSNRQRIRDLLERQREHEAMQSDEAARKLSSGFKPNSERLLCTIRGDNIQYCSSRVEVDWDPDRMCSSKWFQLTSLVLLQALMGSAVIIRGTTVGPGFKLPMGRRPVRAPSWAPAEPLMIFMNRDVCRTSSMESQKLIQDSLLDF
eukprot:maker-scaffold2259_size17954-snap-gene-0.4 protein:Tk03760 transcript:maker-scaffold2259_size17954-snap-gene-0.4-mRNA-1 annotation:"hypothetical protein DAPPUDRAFT_105663"